MALFFVFCGSHSCNPERGTWSARGQVGGSFVQGVSSQIQDLSK